MMGLRFPKFYFLDELLVRDQATIGAITEVTNAYWNYLTSCRMSSTRLIVIKVYAQLYYSTYAYYAQCIYTANGSVATLGAEATLTLTSLSGTMGFDAAVHLLRSSDTKSVLFWLTTSGTLAGSCVNLSTNTCTQSTIYTTLLSDVTAEYSITNITDTQFLIIWKNSSGAYYAATLSVAGNVITAGTSYALSTTTPTNYSSVGVSMLTPTRALVVAVNQTTSYRLMAFTIDIAGTVLTRNTVNYSTLAGVVPMYQGYNVSGYVLGMGSHNKTIIPYSDTLAYVVGVSGTAGSAGSYNRYVPITISGTTTTVGTMVSAFGGTGTRYGFAGDGFGDGTWVFATGDRDTTYSAMLGNNLWTSRSNMTKQKVKAMTFYNPSNTGITVYATNIGVHCLNTSYAYLVANVFHQNGGSNYYGVLGKLLQRY